MTSCEYSRNSSRSARASKWERGLGFHFEASRNAARRVTGCRVQAGSWKHLHAASAGGRTVKTYEPDEYPDENGPEKAPRRDLQEKRGKRSCPRGSGGIDPALTGCLVARCGRHSGGNNG